jgi:tape measure domain-containing protein
MAANDNGRSRYSIVLDNSQLQADALRASNILKGIGNSAEAEGSRIDNAYKRIAGSIAGIFTIQQAAQFVKQIANVRGEFQQLEVAFETMLKSKSEADALMSQLVRTAAVTPFGLKDVAGGAKQLLAYGEASKTVNDTLVRLGNIASGLSIPLNDLVYLYGTTMVQGRLFTQDVRQFQGRGIPLVQELSKTLGKTTDEINEMVTAGKIGFPEVQKVIQNLTNEGGTFYNLMEKQSKTITGQISNLGDAWDTMLNKIGQSSEGVISGAISGATSLIENYEAVGLVLAGLIATYGAYKAALIVHAVLQKAYNAELMRQALIEQQRAASLGINMTLQQAQNTVIAAGTVQVKLHTLAQQGLTGAIKATTAAMMKNPYALIAVAVAALAYGIYKLVTAETEEEKAQRKLNEAMEAAKEKKENIKGKTNELISIIQDETQTIYAQIKAYEELKKAMPEAFAGMSKEQIQALTQEEIQKAVNKATDNMEFDAVNKMFTDAQGKVENLRKRLDQLVFEEKKSNAGPILSLQKQIKQAVADMNEAKKKLDEMNRIKIQAEFDAKPLQEKIAFYNEEIAKLDEQKRQLDTLLLGNKEITGEWGQINFGTMQNISQLKTINDLLNEMKGKRDTLQSLPQNANYGELFSNAKAEWDAARKVLASIEKDKEKYTKEQYENAVKDLEAKKKTYENLGGDTKEQQPKTTQKDYTEQTRLTLEKIKEMQQRLKRQLTDGEIELQQEMINLMDDGMDKQITQIDLDYSKREDEIKKKSTELLKIYQDIERAEWEAAHPDWKEKKMTFTPTILQLPSDAQKLIDDEMFLAEEKKRNDTANLLKSMLKQYSDFNKQREDLEKQYNEDVKYLQSNRNEQNANKIERTIAERTKQYKNSLKQINDAEFSEAQQHSSLFIRLFSESAQLSKKQLQEVIEETKRLIESGGETDPERLIAIYDALIEKQNELDKRTNYPFSSIIKGFEQLRESAYLSKKSIEITDEKTKQAYEKQAYGLKNKGIDYIKSGAAEAAYTIGTLAGYMEQLAEASGDERFKEFSSQMSAMSKNLSAAGKGAQQGGWIGAIIGGLTDIISQTIEGIAVAKAEEIEFEQNRIDFNRAYAASLLELKDEDYESLFGIKTIGETRDAYAKAQEALRAYVDEVTKRTIPEIEKEYRSLGLTIFGAGALSGAEWLGLGKTITNESKAVLEAYKKGYTDLQSMAIKTKDRNGWQNFWGMKDEYKSLKDIAPELWGDDGSFNVEAAKVFLDTNTQISEEQKKQIQNVIDLHDSYDELTAMVDEQLEGIFGHLSGDITDAIFDSVRNGSDAWDLFEDAGLKAIDTLGKQLIKEMYIQAYLDTFRDRMREAYGRGSIEETQQELALIMTDIYGGIGTVLEGASEAASNWDRMAADQGWDVSKLSDDTEERREATAKGLAGLTQDQGDELNGRFTAIQSHTYLITENTKILVVNSGRILQHLSGIESNTKYCERLETIESDMRAVKNGIDDINLKGITIKK